MIVVDTSALMAVVLDEPAAKTCSEILARADEIMISAGTLAEALIVAARRGVGPVMERLIRGLGCQVIAVTEQGAFKVVEPYARWGRGIHPAGELGDCFAYALAPQRARSSATTSPKPILPRPSEHWSHVIWRRGARCKKKRSRSRAITVLRTVRPGRTAF